MTPKERPISAAGIKIPRSLAEKGFRIFTTDDAKETLTELGLSETYLNQALFHLRKNQWIEPIRRGVYSLNAIFLSGTPIHEFEIAMTLAETIVISHLSAFHHHGFTDQIPTVIYTTLSTSSTIPRPLRGEKFSIRGVSYHFTQVKKSLFFGHTTIWVGEAKVRITDQERTLLDGLIKPQYCGGFQEVFSAYQTYFPDIDLEKLVEYALKLGASNTKRLGWILEKLGVQEFLLSRLEQTTSKGFTKLDVSSPKGGIYNKRWKVQENL